MFLQKIQFPWRWLSIASLSGSILFGLALPFILFRKGRLRRLTAYPVMAFILVLFLFNISQDMIPSTPVSRADFQDKITNMYQEEACDCWWPIWAKREAFDTRRPDAGGRDASTFGSTEYTSQITVSAGRAGQLRIPRFYHPYWTAAVNGTPVQVNKDESGAIVIPIPSEPADVSLVFKEPAYVWPATILSFLTWGFILLFLSGYYLRRVSGHLALTHLH